jgi:nucleotide-binding universal stress UspA family protein
MRIVIGYDGSDYAKACVNDLPRSGFPHAAHAIVITVGETAVPLRPAGMAVDVGLSRRVSAAAVQAQAQASHALEEARRLAEEGAARVRERFPNWEIRPEALVGTPAPALMQRAEECDADLIAIGSQGRSAIGRFVLGSVSKQVATESSCSVLVSRHVIDRGDAPVRIIVGVDGSGDSAAMVRVVEGRAWPNGTEAKVIAVDDTFRPTLAAKVVPGVAASVSESNAARVLEAHEMVQYASEAFRRVGLQVSAELKQGSAQRLLSEEAAHWGADCIIVGSRGFSTTLERVRAGSVSTALVTSAPCSVEIVRSQRPGSGGTDDESGSVA